MIADHLRTISFAVADGGTPGSEGRGYVLRRILRRAVRYGIQILGAKPGFFAELVPEVAGVMGAAYPELAEKQRLVVAVVQEEEAAFVRLLDKGARYFNKVAAEVVAGGGSEISGESAFALYDESGFPVDLTQIMAAERGLSVDLAGFTSAMAKQKARSREDTRSKRMMGRTALALSTADIAHLQATGTPPTDDSSKYRWDVAVNTEVQAAFSADGLLSGTSTLAGEDTVGLVLRQTPFYAESGGQVADKGHLLVGLRSGEEVRLAVLDVQVGLFGPTVSGNALTLSCAQCYGGFVLHTCVLDDCSTAPLSALCALESGAKVQAWVDYARRRRVAPNHTATHLLNSALRKVSAIQSRVVELLWWADCVQVVGEAVDQKGSLVAEDKFRFDFGLNRALTSRELVELELLVNDAIRSVECTALLLQLGSPHVQGEGGSEQRCGASRHRDESGWGASAVRGYLPRPCACRLHWRQGDAQLALFDRSVTADGFRCPSWWPGPRAPSGWTAQWSSAAGPTSPTPQMQSPSSSQVSAPVRFAFELFLNPAAQRSPPLPKECGA